MGLDAVELVMEVEDRFGIKVPDAEACRMRTVADMAAFVISQLPRSSDICPTARSFYQFRRLLLEHGGLKRNQIGPRAKLNELLVVGRRRIWSSLRKEDPRLPRLIPSLRVDRVFLYIAAAIFFAALIGLSIISLTYGVWIAMLVGLLCCVSILPLFVALQNRFAFNFPVGIETAGDVARTMAPIEVPMENSGSRLVAQQKVLDEVRRITAEQLGLPLEKVLPESNFVKDLGIE